MRQMNVHAIEHKPPPPLHLLENENNYHAKGFISDSGNRSVGNEPRYQRETQNVFIFRENMCHENYLIFK